MRNFLSVIEQALPNNAFLWGGWPTRPENSEKVTSLEVVIFKDGGETKETGVDSGKRVVFKLTTGVGVILGVAHWVGEVEVDKFDSKSWN